MEEGEGEEGLREGEIESTFPGEGQSNLANFMDRVRVGKVKRMSPRGKDGPWRQRSGQKDAQIHLQGAYQKREAMEGTQRGFHHLRLKYFLEKQMNGIKGKNIVSFG